MIPWRWAQRGLSTQRELMVPSPLGRWELTAETRKSKDDGWKWAIEDREWHIIGGIIGRNLFWETLAERECWYTEHVLKLFFHPNKKTVFLLPAVLLCQFLPTVWCSCDASSRMVYLPRAFQTKQQKGNPTHHMEFLSVSCPWEAKDCLSYYHILLLLSS